jgi:hypothetical protein
MEKIAENRTRKAGSSPPRAEMPFFKLFILKRLCSKKLRKIQNFVPHRLISRLNPRPLQAAQMLKIQELAVGPICRLVVTSDTNQHHSVQWGDALRLLERAGVIAQAVLTKIHR